VGSRFEMMRRDLFHRLIATGGQRFNDLGCGARAMKRRVLEEISLYGDQHRFLPVLANRQGFRIVEVEVAQSPLDRYSRGYPVRTMPTGYSTSSRCSSWCASPRSRCDSSAWWGHRRS
jgi:hypothetical protein